MRDDPTTLLLAIVESGFTELPPSSLYWAARYQSYPGAMPRSCLIATVTNAEGEIVALQSTEIDLETGAKSSRTDKPRRSRGPVSEGAVFLGNPDDPAPTLVLGEGVETVLTRCLVGPCDAYAIDEVWGFPRGYYLKLTEIRGLQHLDGDKALKLLASPTGFEPVLPP